jgi:folate receptor
MKTTYEFQVVNTSWHGFNYDHCGKLSDKCRTRFLQDLCLYECDPYLSQWIVPEKVQKKISNK